MKIYLRILWLFVPSVLFLVGACEPANQGSAPPAETDSAQSSGCEGYAPTSIEILPLTEFAQADDQGQPSRIRVYVSLLDCYGCQIKSAGVFRFELFERVPRSAVPKGKRIAIWPSVDLTSPDKNQQHWRDYLRAYEFELDFEPESGRDYILEVTCSRPLGRRLSAEIVIAATG